MSSSIQPKNNRYILSLTLAALGVVYGDIGTSPLYALRECFHGSYAIQPTPTNVLGVLSLIVWTLIIVVSLKYITFILRADNRGEGGNLALMALALPHRMFAHRAKKRVWLIQSLGLAGAALIYGDGMITPAISVLSAMEGLKVVTPALTPFVIPLTILILCGIFLVQRFGTARVGAVFGPIMVLWFLCLSILGIRAIIDYPAVFEALNPLLGISLLLEEGKLGIVVLGSVFLVTTGAEALFADMGHFGRGPIRIGWFGLVMPSLLLNYFGQGALILKRPETVHNPFFLLAPSTFLIPLVILATLATIIASQALISGAFSLTKQAVQLGYLPRLNIQHTSAREIGQIYIPLVNYGLLICTIFFVLIFKSSSDLAAAYGIAVATTMVLTTSTMFFVLIGRWRWNPVLAIAISVGFLAIDLLFLSANSLKFFKGGWIPLFIAVIIFYLMTTWRNGRVLLGSRLQEMTPSIKEFLAGIRNQEVYRVPGSAIFMTTNLERTPIALSHNLKHNKILHQQVILLKAEIAEVPHLEDSERVEVKRKEFGFFAITLRFGFMEDTNVIDCFELIRTQGCNLQIEDTTFFLGRETLIPSRLPGMSFVREHLFAFMSRNAQRAPTYFEIPAEKVIEIGFPLEI